VDCIELLIRLDIRSLIAGVGQLALRGVDNKEGAVVLALAHLDEVNLLVAANSRVVLRAILLGGVRIRRELFWRQLAADVLVSVERQAARVDFVGVANWIGRDARAGSEGEEEQWEAAHTATSTRSGVRGPVSGSVATCSLPLRRCLQRAPTANRRVIRRWMRLDAWS